MGKRMSEDNKNDHIEKNCTSNNNLVDNLVVSDTKDKVIVK